MSLSSRDNTLSKARNLGLLGTSRSLGGLVGKQDRQDSFKFALRRRSSFSLSLDRLQDNIDVFLYNSNQKLIGQSRQQGKKSESIRASLNAGNYYVQVRTKSRRNRINYRLNLTANNAATGGNGNNPPIPKGSAPILSINNGLRLGGGGSAAIDGSLLRALDSEQGAEQLTYTLTNLPQQGTLFRDGQALSAGDTFTQTDIDRGAINYQSQPTTQRVDGIIEAIEGNKIIFSQQIDGNKELFLFDASTGASTRLTTNAVDDQLLDFNGSTAVWKSLVDSSGDQLFAYNVAIGGQAKQLTDDGATLTTSKQSTFLGLIDSQVIWRSTVNIDRGVSNALFVNNTSVPGGSNRKIFEGKDINIYVQMPEDDLGPRLFFTVENTANSASRDYNEFFVYDGATEKTVQLSDAEKRPGGIGVNYHNGQEYIVWQGIKKSSTRANEISFFQFNTKNNQTISVDATPINRPSTPVILTGDKGNFVWVDLFMVDGVQKNYLYNAATGKTIDLFANSDPRFSRDRGSRVVGLAGTNVVWITSDGTDTELRLYRSDTGETIPLTDGDLKNDEFLGMDSSTVLWETDKQVFAYDIATKVKRPISNENIDVISVNGANAVWTDNETRNLFSYNSNTKQTIQLTTNPSLRYFIEGSGELGSFVPGDNSNIYWRTDSSGFHDYFFFKNDGTTNQSTWLFRDYYDDGSIYSGALIDASGSNVAWRGATFPSDQSFTFYSNGSFASADNFSFTVSDGVGGIANGTFNITVS